MKMLLAYLLGCYCQYPWELHAAHKHSSPDCLHSNMKETSNQSKQIISHLLVNCQTLFSKGISHNPPLKNNVNFHGSLF